MGPLHLYLQTTTLYGVIDINYKQLTPERSIII